jgi:hypothetical protein
MGLFNGLFDMLIMDTGQHATIPKHIGVKYLGGVGKYF